MDSSGNQIDRLRAAYHASYQDINQEDIGLLLRMLKNLVSPNCFDLSDSEIEGFLNVDIQEFRKWIALAEQRQRIQLSDDALCRICIMFDIYQLSKVLFGHQKGVLAMIMSSPNRQFNGLSAKQCIMNTGDTSGLLEIWFYLFTNAKFPGYIPIKERITGKMDPF